jgi:hypothetical protein
MIYRKMRTATKVLVLAAATTLLLVHGTVFAEALKATPSHFEFGTLNEGDPAEVTVEIENTGSERVEITNVQTS